MRETSVNGRAGKSGASLSQMFLFIWEGVWGLDVYRRQEVRGQEAGGGGRLGEKTLRKMKNRIKSKETEAGFQKCRRW